MNERIMNILCAHETKRKVKVVINMNEHGLILQNEINKYMHEIQVK